MHKLIILPEYQTLSEGKRRLLWEELRPCLARVEVIEIDCNRIDAPASLLPRRYQDADIQLHWLHPWKHRLDYRDYYKKLFMQEADAFHIIGNRRSYRRLKRLAREAHAPLLFWDIHPKPSKRPNTKHLPR